MRYWWVNHNQTFEQELGDGYLWSPQRRADGVRNQFYENMRLADPGDRVLSYARKKVAHVGVVERSAVVAPKPESFGAAGENWSRVGWLLPIDWRPLVSPFRPKHRIRELRRHLPEKYSPINKKTGFGNQNAYLAEVNAHVFALVAGVRRIEIREVGPSNSLGDSAIKQIDDGIQDQIENDLELDATTKRQAVDARRGQGKFRERIWRYESGCRLTGIQNPKFLIASHIKPWRVCDSAKERLDGANGLLLAPHVDFLFDRGLIGFADEGDVLVSPKLGTNELNGLGLLQACEKTGRPFDQRQTEYLAYHRENVYLK